MRLIFRFRSLIPRDVIDETLRTYSLLFPQSNIETRKWYRKISKSLQLDPKVAECGMLQARDRNLDQFYYWKDRLIILKQVFDDSEPRTLWQWWYDRRKRTQWYTFWVAIMVLLLTIFFGLVQSIEGALQVYKAFFPPV
jgi:hypothetical protein